MNISINFCNFKKCLFQPIWNLRKTIVYKFAHNFQALALDGTWKKNWLLFKFIRNLVLSSVYLNLSVLNNHLGHCWNAWADHKRDGNCTICQFHFHYIGINTDSVQCQCKHGPRQDRFSCKIERVGHDAIKHWGGPVPFRKYKWNTQKTWHHVIFVLFISILVVVVGP